MYNCYKNVRQLSENIEPCVNKGKEIQSNLSEKMNKIYSNNLVSNL